MKNWNEVGMVWNEAGMAWKLNYSIVDCLIFPYT